MKKKPWGIIILVFIMISVAFAINQNSKNSNDEWHNRNGSEIVCRVYGCGKKPVYSNWDDRFCADHLYKSLNHSSQYNPSTVQKRYNYRKALTKEEADALRGTGYHGTRPNSAAENAELKAAMNTCPSCGMYADRGAHNLCSACQYNKDHGID